MSTAYRDESSGADRRIGSMRLPRLGAVITASIVAGLVFAMMEMVLVAVVMGKPWYGPLHMIAAIGMGPQGVLPPPPAFDFGVAAVAVLIHMVMSILLGMVFATVLLAFRSSMAWLIGLIFGVALYYINFYGFTALFPWFAEARGWIALVSHAAFGLVLALVYRGMDKREAIAPPVGPRA